MSARAVLTAVLMLAACSRAPEPAPTPTPTPTPTTALLPPAPPGGTAKTRLPAPELDATGVSPGAWRFQASATGAAAIFADGLFAIRCDPRRREVVFVRPGTSAAIRILTDTGAATYPATRQNGEAVAATSVSDAFLTDVLAPATARIGIVTDDATIVVRPDEAIADVIRSCRRAAGLIAPR